MVGVDNSGRSATLLRWADGYAIRTGSRLIALTAVSAGLPDQAVPGEVVTAAEQTLDAAITAALPPGRAELAIRWIDPGDPVEALVRRPGWPVRLVVIGAHEGHLLHAHPSVSLRVAGHATAPVAVVHGEPAGGGGRVVVGIDGSPCSRPALAWAVEYARLTGGQVTAVLAWRWHPQYGAHPYGRPRDVHYVEEQRLLHAELAKLPDDDADLVVGVVHEGEAPDVLESAAESADLVVVGTHGHGPVAGRLLGSVSQGLVRHCPVPVVVVPATWVPQPPSATVSSDGSAR